MEALLDSSTPIDLAHNEDQLRRGAGQDPLSATTIARVGGGGERWMLGQGEALGSYSRQGGGGQGGGGGGERVEGDRRGYLRGDVRGAWIVAHAALGKRADGCPHHRLDAAEPELDPAARLRMRRRMATSEGVC